MHQSTLTPLKQDEADKVVGELVQYTQDSVLTLKTVIDAQLIGDAARVYTTLREAAMHMQMIADPLADAIAKRFPGKFVN